MHFIVFHFSFSVPLMANKFSFAINEKKRAKLLWKGEENIFAIHLVLSIIHNSLVLSLVCGLAEQTYEPKIQWLNINSVPLMTGQECTGSICMAYGLESCQCRRGPNHPITKSCELCCRLPSQDSTCKWVIPSLSGDYSTHCPFRWPSLASIVIFPLVSITYISVHLIRFWASDVISYYMTANISPYMRRIGIITVRPLTTPLGMIPKN